MREAVQPDWRWKIQFLRGLISGDYAHAGPFTAAIDVTRRCNLQCFGCRFHSPNHAWLPSPHQDDFDWEDFRRVCGELRLMRTRKMILIGEGEPMLHPRLFDMIAEAKNSGFHVVLLTNGTRIEDESARALAQSGLDELRISLWAADEKEYEKNYPGTDPRFFSLVCKGARAVSELRKEYNKKVPRIVLHRPIDREHFRNLGGMIDLAEEAGCDVVSFSPLKPLGSGDMERALAPEEEKELCDLLRQLDRRARQRGLETNAEATIARYRIGSQVWLAFPCYIGWLDVRIRTNGDVLACSACRQVLGNIRQSSMVEIWNDHAFRRFRKESRTRAGLERIARECTCEFCCHALTNARLHRLLRWLPPLIR
jgi:radical SAM protein with 4Fe4S-binding SPASM domain